MNQIATCFQQHQREIGGSTDFSEVKLQFSESGFSNNHWVNFQWNLNKEMCL